MASIKLSLSEDWSQLLVFLNRSPGPSGSLSEAGTKFFRDSRQEVLLQESERFCTALQLRMSHSGLSADSEPYSGTPLNDRTDA